MRAPIVVLALLATAFAGCVEDEASGADVVATFYPLAFVAERLAGPNLTVGTLVPSGIEPHDWEPVASDVARLSGAKLLARQGAGFEPWLEGLLANAGGEGLVVVDTTANLTLAQRDGERDPHTWLDPVLLAQQAMALQEAMAARFPEEADGIRARGGALAADLGQLHLDMERGLSGCEIDVIIANHDAYGYMAERYGFRVESLSGLSPESEPDSQTLARAVEVAREHNITIIFFEELVSPRVAQVVASEVGATTRVLSPIEGLTEDARASGGDYATLMRENLAGLREAMRCG